MKKQLILLILAAFTASVSATTTNDLITVKDGNLIAFCGEQFGKKLSRPSTVKDDKDDEETLTMAIEGLPTWRKRDVVFGYNKGIMYRGQFSLAIPLKEGEGLKDGNVEEWVCNAFAALTSEVFANIRRILATSGKESNPKLSGWGEDKEAATAEWTFSNGGVLLCCFKDATKWELVVLAVVSETSAVEEKNAQKDSDKITLQTKSDVKAFGSKSGEVGYITLPSGNKIEMIWCEPGSFMMGARNKDECDDYTSARPRHAVQLTHGFWIGKHLVSQAVWKEIMGINPSDNDDGDIMKEPVTNVSFYDCLQFCYTINKVTGLTLRLPTEAEWEYACRAGTTTAYWWGNEYSEASELAANNWGVMDLNLLNQYCSDAVGKNFYERSPKCDPQCKISATPGMCCQLRGGKKWQSYRNNLMTVPFSGSGHIGVRLVCFSLDPKSEKINPAKERGVDNKVEILDVDASPFFERMCPCIDEVVTDGCGQRLGVLKGDIVCKYGNYMIGGNIFIFRDQIVDAKQKAEAREKTLTLARKSENGFEIHTFEFDERKWGLMFANRSLSGADFQAIQKALKDGIAIVHNDKSPEDFMTPEALATLRKTLGIPDGEKINWKHDPTLRPDTQSKQIQSNKSSERSKDIVIVEKVYPGGNAERLGVKEGDVICMCAQESGGYSCLNDKLEKIGDILPVMRHAMKKSFGETTFFVSARNGKDGIEIHVFKFNPGNMGVKLSGASMSTNDFETIKKAYKDKLEKSNNSEVKNGKIKDEDNGLDDMDENEAYSSTGFREVARQMRFLAAQCRVQAQQAQINAQQMSMFANSYDDAAMVMSANNMGQVSSQFAELYDRMADEWESLDDDEKDYFNDMKSTTSRKERTEMFIEAREKLHQLISVSDTEGAWKLYAATRRAVMAFRRSIDPVQKAEEWVRLQDKYYMELAMRQQATLQQNAMNMAMQSFAGANESFKRSLEASKLPSRRCGACNKQYYGYGNCPQCSGPRYGLRSKLVDDDDHPGEKVRIYW